MSKTPRIFTVTEIVQRAEQLGILLSVHLGKLQLEAAPGVITAKVLAVINERKPEIIAHLQSEQVENERYQREIDESIAQEPDLCVTCLDEDPDRETPATVTRGELNYCQAHDPERSMVVVDGVRITCPGYSHEEWMDMLNEDASDTYKKQRWQELSAQHRNTTKKKVKSA